MKVAELITILQTLPQDVEVRMSMNSEYECMVDRDMVFVYTNKYNGDTHVRIDSEGESSFLAS